MSFALTVKTAGVVANPASAGVALPVLQVGDAIAAFVTGDERGRVFLPAVAPVVTTTAAALPTVGSITQVTAPDTGAPWYSGNTSNGPVKVALSWAATDLVNAPSVYVPVFDAETLVLVASG